MATVAFPKSEIADRVAGIMADDSALMRQAAASGTKSAGRRGLINSSMGIGAATNAMLGAATPIASQESSQAAAERNLKTQIDANRESQTQQIGATADLQAKQITSQEGINRANLAAAERERMLSGQVQMMGNYSQSLANTLQNDKIPATARGDVQSALLRQYQDSMAFMQNLYGVQVPVAVAPQVPADVSGIGYAGAYPYNVRSLYA